MTTVYHRSQWAHKITHCKSWREIPKTKLLENASKWLKPPENKHECGELLNILYGLMNRSFYPQGYNFLVHNRSEIIDAFKGAHIQGGNEHHERDYFLGQFLGALSLAKKAYLEQNNEAAKKLAGRLKGAKMFIKDEPYTIVSPNADLTEAKLKAPLTPVAKAVGTLLDQRATGKATDAARGR